MSTFDILDHLLTSQIYIKYFGAPIKQNRMFVQRIMNSKFGRTEGWQRAGSTGICWQADTGTCVSETVPQKQMNKNTPRFLPLLH